MRGLPMLRPLLRYTHAAFLFFLRPKKTDAIAQHEKKKIRIFSSHADAPGASGQDFECPSARRTLFLALVLVLVAK